MCYCDCSGHITPVFYILKPVGQIQTLICHGICTCLLQVALSANTQLSSSSVAYCFCILYSSWLSGFQGFDFLHILTEPVASAVTCRIRLFRSSAAESPVWMEEHFEERLISMNGSVLRSSCCCSVKRPARTKKLRKIAQWVRDYLQYKCGTFGVKDQLCALWFLVNFCVFLCNVSWKLAEFLHQVHF